MTYCFVSLGCPRVLPGCPLIASSHFLLCVLDISSPSCPDLALPFLSFLFILSLSLLSPLPSPLLSSPLLSLYGLAWYPSQEDPTTLSQLQSHSFQLSSLAQSHPAGYNRLPHILMDEVEKVEWLSSSLLEGNGTEWFPTARTLIHPTFSFFLTLLALKLPLLHKAVTTPLSFRNLTALFEFYNCQVKHTPVNLNVEDCYQSAFYTLTPVNQCSDPGA